MAVALGLRGVVIADITAEYRAGRPYQPDNIATVSAVQLSYYDMGVALARRVMAAAVCASRSVWWDHLRSLRWLETQNALSSVFGGVAASIDKHVHHIENTGGQARFPESCEVAPVTYASIAGTGLKNRLDNVPKQEESGKRMVFFPIVTCMPVIAGFGEEHAVGLVILFPKEGDGKGKILFLDSKGHDPRDLYLMNHPMPGAPASEISCADLIDRILQHARFQNVKFDIETSPSFQNTRDCTICVLTMLAKLAHQLDQGEEPSLAQVIEDLHTHYDQISDIRARALAARTVASAQASRALTQ